MKVRNSTITVLSLVITFVMVIQVRSFEGIDTLLRDQKSNVFQEIMILKQKNESLESEVLSLERTIKQLEDQNLALEAVSGEIEKYTKLSGAQSIFGPGVKINFDSNVSTFWMIDIVNELLNSGAEAIAVNGIRLTNRTIGFDTLPQGQILLNGSILTLPYQIDVIGEPNVIVELMELKGGIVDRLIQQFPGTKVSITPLEFLQMN